MTTPQPSSVEAQRRMNAQRRRDTRPEMELRRALHRFWVDRAPLPGLRSRADIVFPRARAAIFVDGCFWHSCPIHSTIPRANREWWSAKLAANRDRDSKTNQRLADHGWLPIRIWEHQDPEVTALEIEHLISGLLLPRTS